MRGHRARVPRHTGAHPHGSPRGKMIRRRTNIGPKRAVWRVVASHGGVGGSKRLGVAARGFMACRAFRLRRPARIRLLSGGSRRRAGRRSAAAKGQPIGQTAGIAGNQILLIPREQRKFPVDVEQRLRESVARAGRFVGHRIRLLSRAMGRCRRGLGNERKAVSLGTVGESWIEPQMMRMICGLVHIIDL